MSNIKKCDRCGEPYDPFLHNITLDSDWWRYSIHKDCHPYEEIKIDLCSDCRKKLYKWLGGES